jgi:hypothetical protein
METLFPDAKIEPPLERNKEPPSPYENESAKVLFAILTGFCGD